MRDPPFLSDPSSVSAGLDSKFGFVLTDGSRKSAQTHLETQ